MDNNKLYEMQQAGIGTDCSFVFQNDDGSSETIFAHKLVLSTASEVFETNFKDEWNGDQPILVTSVDSNMFKRLIRGIYINDIGFKTLEDAGDFYDAAHFYQVEIILDILRGKMCRFCAKHNFTAFSRLINTGWKYQDMKLIGFAGKYFARNVEEILKDPDFLKCSPDSINYLYQIDDFQEGDVEFSEQKLEEFLLTALEKYVIANGTSLKLLRPAIGTIRFSQLKSSIMNTPVLTEMERNSLLRKNLIKFTYLSKKEERNLIDLPCLD